jgi:hypothetical protein
MGAKVEILREAYAAKHKRRGRHSKLEVEEMLICIRVNIGGST